MRSKWTKANDIQLPKADSSNGETYVLDISWELDKWKSKGHKNNLP